MAEAKAWVMIPISKNKGTEVEIDMRPLVLCKDCKFIDESVKTRFFCGRLMRCVDADWFCADGERSN